MKKLRYRAIVSSDWNECLAPCGPFDFISFVYPELSGELSAVFKQYTGNRIPLSRAIGKIRMLLPAPVTREQMDAYIDAHFITYPGVPDLIDWCLAEGILFMINTTGGIGYFQRLLAKKLIPPIPILSAHPHTIYPQSATDPPQIMKLLEVQDKGANTQQAVTSMQTASPKIILMGDSGGDGPHFQWGAAQGAFLIGCMTKASLQTYCRANGIRLDLMVGPCYEAGETRRATDETGFDFRNLIPVIADAAGT